MSGQYIPDSEDKPKLGGSVFLNNTSYSGADIKLVLNMYDGGKAAQGHILSLTESLKQTYEEIAKVDTEIRVIFERLRDTKAATPESYALGRKLDAVLRRKEISLGFIESARERIRQLQSQRPTMSTKVLAEAQSLSVSVHRDKAAVRACGSVYPKAFTRGPREIAGSIVFTVFDKNVLYEFLEADPSDFDAYAGFTTALVDQLPPVDITVAFANEYGSVSRMAIYGVEFIDEGQVMSIEDLLTENVVHWVARDIDPMRDVSRRKMDENNRMVAEQQGFKRASSLILETDYQSVKNNLDPFSRFINRRDPFL
jgi:hypothetical protein